VTHDHGNQESSPNFWRTRYGIGCLVIGAVAAYFLLTEHLAHTVSALPYLLFAACPLMHFFMHGGHGHGDHGHGHGHGRNKDEAKGSTDGDSKKGDQP
jgi:hypothetical protein